MKVYLAGASCELSRVKKWASHLIDEGFELTCKWWDDVEAAGDANPAEGARDFALKDIAAVEDSDVFWLLVPKVIEYGNDHFSHGAFFEFGYSYAADESSLKLVSGDVDRSIFCSLASRFSTDERAFWYLCGYRQRLVDGGDS